MREQTFVIGLVTGHSQGSTSSRHTSGPMLELQLKKPNKTKEAFCCLKQN